MAKAKGGIRPISHALPCSGSELRLIGISDVHIGDPHCNISIFRNLIRAVETDDDCYAVLLGDLCNTALATSKSDVYAETMPPKEQAKKAAEMLKPIAGKILAVVPGNHEERISRNTGYDLTEGIAARLGIEELYRPASALLFLTVGSGQGAAHGRPPTYSIYMNHGSGGGATIGSKANGLEKQAKIIDTDIIMRGHTHVPLVDKQPRFVVCKQNRTAELREQLMVNTASCLEYPESYADRMCLQPGSNQYPVVHLSATELRASATL